MPRNRWQGDGVTGSTAPRGPATLPPRHPNTLSVLDGIASLIDQSLLRHISGPTSEPRYSMLETVREFGLERLEESGEERAVRAAHAAFFQALASEVRARQFAPGFEQVLTQLDTEHDNVR